MIFNNIINKNNLKYFIILIFDKIHTLFFTLFSANKLLSKDYGVMNQLFTISSIFSNLLIFGISTPLIIYFFSEKLSKNELINLSYYFITKSMKFFLPIILVFLIFPSFFEQLFFKYNNYNLFIYFLIISIIIDVSSEFVLIYSRLIESKTYIANYFLLKNLIRYLSFIVSFLISKNFIFSFTFSFILSSLYVANKYFKIFKQKQIPVKFKNNINLRISNEGINYFLFYILSNASLYTINFFLIKFYDLNTVAVYSYNNSLATLPSFLITSIGYILFPKFTKELTDKNYKYANRILLVSSFFFVLLFTFSEIVVFIIFNYSSFTFLKSDLFNYKILILLCVANLLVGLNTYLQYPLVYFKKFKFIFIALFVTIMINLLIIIIFKNKFNSYTPIYSFLISTFSLFIFNLFFNYFYISKIYNET